MTNSWIAFATLLYIQRMLRKQSRQNDRQFEEATTPASMKTSLKNRTLRSVKCLRVVQLFHDDHVVRNRGGAFSLA